MGFVFLVSLILILYIILIFNFFETHKQIASMTEQIKDLKEKAEIPTVNLSPSDALDALKAEIEARQKKKEEEEAKAADEREESATTTSDEAATPSDKDE